VYLFGPMPASSLASVQEPPAQPKLLSADPVSQTSSPQTSSPKTQPENVQIPPAGEGWHLVAAHGKQKAFWVSKLITEEEFLAIFPQKKRRARPKHPMTRVGLRFAVAYARAQRARLLTANEYQRFRQLPHAPSGFWEWLQDPLHDSSPRRVVNPGGKLRSLKDLTRRRFAFRIVKIVP